MSKNPRSIIFEPVVSEKAYDLIEKTNTFTFTVDRRANKTEIKQAIASIFDVDVLSVRTMKRTGKSKRTGLHVGKRSDVKYARVTLAEGDTIDVFGV